jgi:hypothetical protein
MWNNKQELFDVENTTFRLNLFLGNFEENSWISGLNFTIQIKV